MPILRWRTYRLSDWAARHPGELERESGEMPSTKSVVRGVGLVVGLLLLIGGLVGLFYVPKVINDQVVGRDVIGYDTLPNGTRVLNDMTKKWIHPPYEMILHVYMYSVQNEQAFLDGKEKIRLSQKGPYSFVEDQLKNFTFSPDESRIFYSNNHSYYFSPNHSCAECSLDDVVTVPNVLFQKLVDIAEGGIAQRLAVQSVLAILGRESPFVTIKMREALFEGYEDPLISLLCGNKIIGWICKTAKIPDRIGFFYGQNNSFDGVYEVGTGKNGPSELGKMFSWNGAATLPDTWWESPYARAINGTDGQLFPPLLQKDVVLPLFASQACRSVKMAYVDDSEFAGISSWRYSPPTSMNDPSQPDNHIFCHVNSTVSYFDDPKVQYPGCLPAGMMDLSKCQPGEPRVYLSQAHFFMSPKEVWSSVEGVDAPSADRDTTYVDIEPTAGVPIYAKRVMQVNVGMKRGNLGVLAKTNNTIVPVFWINETAVVDPETKDQLTNELQAAKHYAFIGGISALTVGALLFIGVLLTVLLDKALGNRDEETQPMVSGNEDAQGEENVAADYSQDD